MALNALMHPRNPYKITRPDFRLLAEKYELFRNHSSTDQSGRVHIDFRNPECLRALTWALLKDGFDLDVDMPIDRLIPTVPLRLNYILWLEDILGVVDTGNADWTIGGTVEGGGKIEVKKTTGTIRGIDIGCGSACIYSLLGARRNGWMFLATEADDTNVEYAIRNVSKNSMVDKIKIVKVAEDSTLFDLHKNTANEGSTSYDFVMCNPPFYGTNLEAWGMSTTRTDHRPEPMSISTASPIESIVPGGEVEFVNQTIVDSSVSLGLTVRVYSTMLGKKSSLLRLREILKQRGILNIGTTEFCQGRTMRWGLAWSFDPSLAFPKSARKLAKSPKTNPRLTFDLPQKYVSQSVHDIAYLFEQYFKDLHAMYTSGVETIGEKDWTITCAEETWTHQRRRKRQLSRASSGTLPEDNRREERGQSGARQSIRVCDEKAGGREESRKDGSVTTVGSPCKQQRCDTSCCVASRSSKSSSEEETSVSDLEHSGYSNKFQKLVFKSPEPSKGRGGGDTVSGSSIDISGSEGCGHGTNGSNQNERNEDVSMSGSSNSIPQITNDATNEKLDIEKSVLKKMTNSGVDNCEMIDSSSERVDSGQSELAKKKVHSYVCRFSAKLKRIKEGMVLELEWLNGINKEHLYQLLLYFKNRLTGIGSGGEGGRRGGEAREDGGRGGEETREGRAGNVVILN